MVDYLNLTNEELTGLVHDSHSWNEVVTKCGLVTLTRSLQRRIQKYEISIDHLNKHFDGMWTKFNKITKDDINAIVGKHTEWKYIMTDLGYRTCTHVVFIQKKLDNLGIDYSHVSKQYERKLKRHDLKDVMVKDSFYTCLKSLQSRLKRELGWEHKCSVCHLKEWQNKPIPIEIDHINGEHFDHRLENIRFICPNCHAFTDNYKGKNMKVCKNKLPKEVQEPDVYVAPDRIGRKAREKRKATICCNCGGEVCNHTSRCKACEDKKRFLDGVQRKVQKRPTLAQLEEDTKNMPYVKVGEKYGVSDNCIRKWMNLYKKYENS
jgi:hypothetical protein